MTSRRTLAVGAVLAASTLLTGCSFQGAASFPLPGGVGGDGYEVQVEFADVLDLVPQSSVKVNDVAVGSVKKIDISKDGYTALVTVKIKKDVSLPENVDVLLRQTSLLGEKFVSFEKPAIPQGTLRPGAKITLASGRTRANADIEQVLGALSLILNGGSLEQLQVINSELTKALKGRESQVRGFLVQLTGFVSGLDDQKRQITDALDGLDRLTGKLAAERKVLDVALRDLPHGASVLADERAQLTKVLVGLKNLGTVATRVIQATQQNTIADLKALQPILSQLAAAGKALPLGLELLTTYPFPRTVALPGHKGGIRGDYANLYVTLEGDPATLLGNLLGGIVPPTGSASKGAGKTRAPTGLPGGLRPRTSLPEAVTNVPGLTTTTGDLERLLFGGLS